METVIVTTESAIEKTMERVLDKKLPRPPESDVEKTYSINQVARMMELTQEDFRSCGSRCTKSDCR